VEDSSDSTTAEPKRVLILCELDGFANGWKPTEIARFLRERGHDVRLENTYHLSRASSERGSLRSKLPSFRGRRLALYAAEAAYALLTRRSTFGRRHLSTPSLIAQYRLRAKIIRSMLRFDDFDLVLCEHPHDAGALLEKSSARRFHDCMTPWADELLFEGRATPRQHRALRRIETDLFAAVDHLSFSWQTYAGYVVRNYGYDGHNFLQLNWGCTPAPQRARFATPIRLVLLSSLSSQFINLPLLSRLSKQYPHIDVYGAPPPDPALGLNYLGWAPPDVLMNYQIGLITCSTDELRRDGFSAKHLQYIAHGLPVMVPAWRRHLDLIAGSVPYDETTFLSVIEGLSDPVAWRRTSDEAYAQAERLRWDQTLRPLEDLLNELPRRGGSPGPVRSC
jgi:hypothetical protein